VILTRDEVVAAFDRWAVRYVERPGWATRSTGRGWDLRAIFVHHDANNDRVSTERGLQVIEQGRPDLAGPLANSWNEDDGVVYLTALGNTNNAGRIASQAFYRLSKGLAPTGDAGALGWPDDGPVGNTYGWAIEVHNAGDGRDPYEPGQMQSLVLECAAVCDAVGRKVTGRWDAGPSVGWSGNRLWGHRQLTRRKIDPRGIDMAALADAVDVALYAGPAGARPTFLEDEMPTVVAVDLVIDPDLPTRGYKLDASGGIHAFGGAPALTNPRYAEWLKAGIGPARRLVITRWGGQPQGYILDAIGGVHAVGGAPTLTTDGYWSKGFIPPAPLV